MWHFNGEDDATHYGRKGPDTYTALAKILSGLYKAEEEEFIHIKPSDGYSIRQAAMAPLWLLLLIIPDCYLRRV